MILFDVEKPQTENIRIQFLWSLELVDFFSSFLFFEYYAKWRK